MDANTIFRITVITIGLLILTISLVKQLIIKK